MKGGLGKRKRKGSRSDIIIEVGDNWTIRSFVPCVPTGDLADLYI